MTTRLACVLVAAVALAVPATADKLDDLGLDPNGRPWPEAVASGGTISLAHDGSPVRVVRPELARVGDPAERARLALDALLAGAASETERAAGLASPFPVGSQVLALAVRDGNYRVDVRLPAAFLAEVRAGRVSLELLERCLQESLPGADLVRFEVRVEDPATGDLVSPDHFAFRPPLAKDHRADPDLATPGAAPDDAKVAIPVPGDGHPAGSLSGKDVFLNPGHGWVFRDSTTDYWGLQRSFVQNNIEDFSNPDLIDQWLVAYLWNAGADVFSVREVDPQEAMVVVDNDDGSPTYVESGSGWFASTLFGFANGHAPYVNGQDPFSFGSNRLAPCVSGVATAWATWTATIPADGWYWVSVSHGAYTNRSPQAHYTVRHAGGSSEVFVDQRRRRFTWIPLGRFYFEADAPAAERQVVLSNESTSSSHYVSADAVRFGGGLGVISRGTAATSGEPQFVEEARYRLQFAGAGSDVYDLSDTDENDGWSGRPKFGGWLTYQSTLYGAPARPGVFISSHTNAGGGEGLGTYVYTGYESTIHDRFRDAVHDEVLNDLSNGYPGTFGNHGIGKRYGLYGENNPSNTSYGGSSVMPIVLGEWLFHDSAADMAMYHDPKFRLSLARAVYQGVVKFWAAENGSPATLLPEPPQNVSVVAAGATSAVVAWDPPATDGLGVVGDAATGYRLYRGRHGRGFPPGVDLGNVTSVVLSDLTAGVTEYLYVTAANAGGESFPTEVVAVRTSATQSPRVLVVNGFDKLDVSTRQRAAYSGSTLYRQVVNHMNTNDYVVEHARALAAAAPDLAFDACEDEVVGAGDVSLANYDAVVWVGGIQAEVSSIDGSDDTSLTSAQRTALTNYVGAGGKLFISSSELAWDLDRGGSTTFVDSTLHANYVQDSSGSNTVTGVAGSIFAGLGPLTFDDGSGPTYAVAYPDVIVPVGGAVAALAYGGATAVDPFEDVTGWWDPNSSGSTDADLASTFTLVASPVHQGSGAGDLYYVWGSGTRIREYTPDQPLVPAGAVLSLWVEGDASGHTVQLCIRDQVDNDLLLSAALVVDFSGWRQLTWDLTAGPGGVFVQNGNGLIDGTQVAVDSVIVYRDGAGPTSGHLYFDDLTYAGVGGSGLTAAIQYSGTGKVVFLGFPFETVLDATQRTQVMAATLGFFGLQGNGDMIFEDGFE